MYLSRMHHWGTKEAGWMAVWMTSVTCILQEIFFFMDLPSHLCCLAINAEQCGTAVGQIRYHLFALPDGSFRMN